jgi:hypothetical protein
VGDVGGVRPDEDAEKQLDDDHGDRDPGRSGGNDRPGHRGGEDDDEE